MKKQKKILFLIAGGAGVWWGYRMVKKYVLTERKKEIDVIARTVWGEARGEGAEGMVAVANVIQNRVKAGAWYGATYEEVCKKPKQFSCWNTNDPNYNKILNVTEADGDFEIAMMIARAVVDGDLKDITNGATHYHARSIYPSWASSLKQTAQIGNHIFYA